MTPGGPISGPVEFSISGPNVTITQPSLGMSIIENNGSTHFATAVGMLDGVNFTGIVARGDDGSLSASGTWSFSQMGVRGSGTWSAIGTPTHGV